jgi:hypothetical protein
VDYEVVSVGLTPDGDLLFEIAIADLLVEGMLSEGFLADQLDGKVDDATAGSYFDDNSDKIAEALAAKALMGAGNDVAERLRNTGATDVVRKPFQRVILLSVS